MTLNKKVLGGVAVIAFFVIGYIIPKYFIYNEFGIRDIVYPENTKLFTCSNYTIDEDPDVLAANNLGNPIQKLFSIKTVLSQDDIPNGLYIYKSYTFFAIPIATIQVNCKTKAAKTI